jgi:hypothetical protein
MDPMDTSISHFGNVGIGNIGNGTDAEIEGFRYRVDEICVKVDKVSESIIYKAADSSSKYMNKAVDMG